MWAWPPIKIEAHAGWLMRGSDGHTNRANSTLTSRFDENHKFSLTQSITAVEQWYRQHNLNPCFKLCDGFLPCDLDDALNQRSYQIITPSTVMTTNLDQEVTADPNIALDTRPTQASLNVMCDRQSNPFRKARASLLNRIKKPSVIATHFVDGIPAATGLAVLDGAWGSIAGMATLPQYRRQGHAHSILNRLLAWLKSNGAENTFLQVEKDNPPAVRLYEKLGFKPAYDYHYRKTQG